MEQQLFINTIKDAAITTQANYKILASITIAQAILESGWGTSDLFKKANNSFGIKWVEGCGFDKILKSTKEVIDGEETTVKAYFRKYDSLDDNIKDHAIFLQKDRYKNLIGDPEYKSVANKLYEDGYSTSPDYPNQLIKIIEQYELNKFDTMNVNTKGGNKMIIGLRGGHSPNCIGAVGVVDEYNTMQMFYDKVVAILLANGHTVIDCNSNASDQIGELSEGATKANDAMVHLFISFHMNASNGEGHGTEALIASTNSESYPLAQRLCDAFGSLGFTNRGVKVVGDYEMHYINAPNIIFETCFCDNAADVALFNEIGMDKLALTVCKAIDANISAVDSVATEPATTNSPVTTNAGVGQLQHILNNMGITDKNGNSLGEDGIMGALTLSALNKIIVKRGDNSDLVKWIQAKIGVSADGSYGPNTFNALCEFQRSNDLAADGIVGPNTWAALIK